MPEVVGITVHLTFAKRAFELAQWYRSRGSKVVLVGLHVLSCPDECAPYADALAVGDGVQLWPRILADAEAGCLRPKYVATYESDYRQDPVGFIDAFITKDDPKLTILGPGSVGEVGNLGGPSSMHIIRSEDMLKDQGPGLLDGFSYHFYGTVSKRCAIMGHGLGTTPEAALTDDWLSRTNRDEKFYAALRDRFEQGIMALLPDLAIFGAAAPRLANTSLFAWVVPRLNRGMTAETALMALDLDGVMVSSGAACSYGKVAHSHVLAAMGVEDALARSALRVSFGWNSQSGDGAAVLAALEKLAARARARAAA